MTLRLELAGADDGVRPVERHQARLDRSAGRSPRAARPWPDGRRPALNRSRPWKVELTTGRRYWVVDHVDAGDAAEPLRAGQEQAVVRADEEVAARRLDRDRPALPCPRPDRRRRRARRWAGTAAAHHSISAPWRTLYFSTSWVMSTIERVGGDVEDDAAADGGRGVARAPVGREADERPAVRSRGLRAAAGVVTTRVKRRAIGGRWYAQRARVAAPTRFVRMAMTTASTYGPWPARRWDRGRPLPEDRDASCSSTPTACRAQIAGRPDRRVQADRLPRPRRDGLSTPGCRSGTTAASTASRASAFLPPLALTLHEATTLFLAARMLAKTSDEHDTELIGAFVKLAPDPAAGAAPSTSSDTSTRSRRTPRNETFTRVFRVLAEAWARRRVVEIEYDAGVYDPSEGHARRAFIRWRIEPSALTHALYLIGWDEARKAQPNVQGRADPVRVADAGDVRGRPRARRRGARAAAGVGRDRGRGPGATSSSASPRGRQARRRDALAPSQELEEQADGIAALARPRGRACARSGSGSWAGARTPRCWSRPSCVRRWLIELARAARAVPGLSVGAKVVTSPGA